MSNYNSKYYTVNDLGNNQLKFTVNQGGDYSNFDFGSLVSPVPKVDRDIAQEYNDLTTSYQNSPNYQYGPNDYVAFDTTTNYPDLLTDNLSQLGINSTQQPEVANNSVQPATQTKRKRIVKRNAKQKPTQVRTETTQSTNNKPVVKTQVRTVVAGPPRKLYKSRKEYAQAIMREVAKQGHWKNTPRY